MQKALIILHASPEAPDCRALTALRLAGAMLANDKEVRLFLVEDGARLVDANLPIDNPCRVLFHELLDVGLRVQICGATLKKLGWDSSGLPPAIERSSMKALSTLMTEVDEIVTF